MILLTITGDNAVDGSRIYIKGDAVNWIREPAEVEKGYGISAILGVQGGMTVTVKESVGEIMRAIEVDRQEWMRSLN